MDVSLRAIAQFFGIKLHARKKKNLHPKRHLQCFSLNILYIPHKRGYVTMTDNTNGPLIFSEKKKKINNRSSSKTARPRLMHEETDLCKQTCALFSYNKAWLPTIGIEYSD